MSLDARILSALRAAKNGSVAGTDLANSLGVSRAAVWARIEEMRQLGYEIEASPHHGYKLISVPDVLHADDLISRLPADRIIGRDIRVFQETTSTNDVVEKFARDGVNEGVAVFAESQTKGRGRMGRKWISPPGKGLWFSLLLRPKLRPTAVTQITVIAATALVRAIQKETGLQPDIKWPNDIWIKGRKVAGVLTEMSAEMDHVKHVTLGIGLDVNLEEQDLPSELHAIATSLRIESGRKLDRPQIAARLLKELEHDYQRICHGKFEAVADEWEQRCITVGKQVSITLGATILKGRAEALDADGALLLRTQYGHLERIIGGDVTLEKN
ncbi:MAG TPA: biotin--[acetyl-CoA-carboxylase] ligase [Verrucomicrobiae bacterium]